MSMREGGKKKKKGAVVGREGERGERFLVVDPRRLPKKKKKKKPRPPCHTP